jgi:hypothetical protein
MTHKNTGMCAKSGELHTVIYFELYILYVLHFIHSHAQRLCAVVPHMLTYCVCHDSKCEAVTQQQEAAITSHSHHRRLIVFANAQSCAQHCCEYRYVLT